MTEAQKLMINGVIDQVCGCCGEKYEDGIYENPWGGPGNSYGISRECIMVCIEDCYDENYDGGYDLTTDSEYWKTEYKKSLDKEKEDESEAMWCKRN